MELANSGFEYFAGGEFQKVNGDGTGPNNHEVAAQAGYNVVTTQAGAAALKAGAGKTLIIAENLADGKAMNYAMDAAPGEWQLTDYVRKGIELLDNSNGFFMMVESGKIDWACHANDAAASIHDVIEMHNAVQAAVEFYAQHPDNTLILVTADHETGGLGIGYKTTNYDTFLTTGVEVHHGTGVGVGGVIHTGLVVDGVADGHAEGDVGAIQLVMLLAHLALAGRADLEGALVSGAQVLHLVVSQQQLACVGGIGVGGQGQAEVCLHILHGSLKRSLILHVVVHIGGIELCVGHLLLGQVGQDKRGNIV